MDSIETPPLLLTPQQYFREQGRRPRKRFGQHFLAQTGIAERIVESAGIERSDVVVEIGPGLGALTRLIVSKVRKLHLVELDRDLARYLEAALPSSEACRIEVHQQDALSFDFRALSRLELQRLLVLGNLPYNISSPLIFHLLECAPAVKQAVFMVQKEVGERLTAEPGGKEYGVLSVLLRAFSRASRLFTVSPGQFYPPPKVDSLVVAIDFPEEPPTGMPSFAFMRRLVNTAFQKRRKTLHNSLKPLTGSRMDLLDAAFARSGIDPGRRPETLNWEEFARLGKVLEAALSATGRTLTKFEFPPETCGNDE